MQPQAKDSQEPPAAGRCGKGPPLESEMGLGNVWRGDSPTDTLISDCWPLELGETKFHSTGLGEFVQQPWEGNPGCEAPRGERGPFAGGSGGSRPTLGTVWECPLPSSASTAHQPDPHGSGWCLCPVWGTWAWPEPATRAAHGRGAGLLGGHRAVGPQLTPLARPMNQTRG